MVLQFLIGTGILAATIVVGGLYALLATTALVRLGPWLVREPHNPKFAIFVIGIVLGAQVAITIAVICWALVFHWLNAFDSMEPALYFAFASFTTLGFGDVLLPNEWRLLSGFAAANGLLLFGLFTAFLVEMMRRVRAEQVRGVPDEE